MLFQNSGFYRETLVQTDGDEFHYLLPGKPRLFELWQWSKTILACTQGAWLIVSCTDRSRTSVILSCLWEEHREKTLDPCQTVYVWPVYSHPDLQKLRPAEPLWSKQHGLPDTASRFEDRSLTTCASVGRTESHWHLCTVNTPAATHVALGLTVLKERGHALKETKTFRTQQDKLEWKSPQHFTVELSLWSVSFF